MKKSGFSEVQIIGFIKQVVAGMPLAELCRMHGSPDASFYEWRAKFGAMDVSDAGKLRELESENAKLNKLLAEAHLDIHALKPVFGAKRQPRRPSGRRSEGGGAMPSVRTPRLPACGALTRQLPTPADRR